MSDKLTEKQKAFCREYIYDWNATRSYKAAGYSASNDNIAGVEAHKLLKNPKIAAYIEEIQKDIEKQAGISRMMVVKRLMNHAFTSIAHLHLTWIERESFEDLTEEQKACIQEISTKIVKIPIGEEEFKEVEFVKIKLYDSQKALEMLSKMLGYNEPEKFQHSGSVSHKHNLSNLTYEQLKDLASGDSKSGKD